MDFGFCGPFFCSFVLRGNVIKFLFTFFLLLENSRSNSNDCQFIADSRTQNRGRFQSPGWPNAYSPDVLCHYKLQGSEWEAIKIVFHQFELEEKYTEGCLVDYVEVTTVDIRGQRTFQGRYCGSDLPPPIYVLHPTAELEFRSNPSVQHSGFLASYEFIDEKNVPPPRLNGTSPCGSIEIGKGGTITSPGYPYGFPAGLDCLWLIRVEYSHAVYIRIRELDFQGSISNCQRAQLTIYDGYESSLEDATVLKKFCGDFRHYPTEDEKVLLSSRNRLLVRFTTGEPSKPTTEPDKIGFKLIWSDVIFDTEDNCTKLSRFACREARYCFTKNHQGGASNCPDLRHYCVFSQLVCDGIPHCGEIDASDEQNCYKSGLVVSIIIIGPLVLIVIGIIVCFICYKSRSKNSGKILERRNSLSLVPPELRLKNLEDSNHQTQRKEKEKLPPQQTQKRKKEPNCWMFRWLWSDGQDQRHQRSNSSKSPKNHQNEFNSGSLRLAAHNRSGGGGVSAARLSNLQIPSPAFRKDKKSSSSDEDQQQKIVIRPPISFKSELDRSSMVSDLDIVSPASGFSDTESDVSILPSSIHHQNYTHCNVHGPVATIPLRYLSRQFSLLPVVHECPTHHLGLAYQSDNEDNNGTFDEESTYSESEQNSDIIQISNFENPGKNHLSHQLPPLLEHHKENDLDDQDDSSPQDQDLDLIIIQQDKKEIQKVKDLNSGFQDWRLRNLRARFSNQRNDAVYLSVSDDGKSSQNSSPTNTIICPKCLELEQNSGQQHFSQFISLDKDTAVQFDSGIDLATGQCTQSSGHGGGGGKNVSFDSSITNNSDCDSVILYKPIPQIQGIGQKWGLRSQGICCKNTCQNVMNQSIQTDPVPELQQQQQQQQQQETQSKNDPV